MGQNWLRAATAAGLTLTVLAGGAAVAAKSAPTGAASRPQARMQAFLNDVAGHLPGTVTGAQLLSAIEAAEVNHVQQAVSAGRVTPAQATRIEARINSGHILPGPWRHARMARRRMMGMGLVLKTAAGYLGVPRTTLAADLRGGESLAAAVAAANNPKLTVAGLEQAIVTALQSRLSGAVQSGRLTAARESRMARNLQTRVDRFVNRVPGRWVRHHGAAGTSPTGSAAGTGSTATAGSAGSSTTGSSGGSTAGSGTGAAGSAG